MCWCVCAGSKVGCMAGKEQCNLWVMGEWGTGLESWAGAPELQGDRKNFGVVLCPR